MKENKYVGAIDQGTTGTRFILFNKKGEIVSKSYEKHEQIYPKPGWVEHDPLEIWKNTQKVLKKSAKEIDVKKIDSIGVTNQRETTVVWDPKTGKPLYNAIVWQDTRTKEMCENLKERELDSVIKNKTGLRAHTYFSGTKLKWLLKNISDSKKRIKNNRLIFGNIDSWIIWNLTGGKEGGNHVTDYTNASRTMLMNIKSLEWDKELLEIFDIPSQILPEIRPSSDKTTYGKSINAPSKIQVPVCGNLGDQQAALFGQTCFEKGDAKNTYGTGCFTLLNTGEEIPNFSEELITTPAYGLSEGNCKYALEGSVPVAGAAIEWLINNLEIIDSPDETEELANSVDDNNGVYFVPAFSGLFAPKWDMSARGIIVGLTGSSNKNHIVRATLESIGFQTNDMLDAMKKNTGVSLKNLKVDGGIAENDFLLQFQADISGNKIMRPKVSETTALGAAYAAGLATGFWEDLETLKENWKLDKKFKPTIDEDERKIKIKEWEKAVQRSRGWTD